MVGIRVAGEWFSGDLLGDCTWDPNQTAPASLRFRPALVSESPVLIQGVRASAETAMESQA